MFSVLATPQRRNRFLPTLSPINTDAIGATCLIAYPQPLCKDLKFEFTFVTHYYCFYEMGYDEAYVTTLTL